MIISHKHKFIFLHIPKTGGSSVTSYLASQLGPSDIQVGLYRETMTAGIAPTRAMVNRLLRPKSVAAFARTLVRTNSLCDSVDAGIKASYRPQLGHQPVHCSASHLANFDPQSWREYLKFCVVRNPFDRAVSDYYWRTRVQNARMPFEEYVQKIYVQGLPPKELGLGTDPIWTWPLYTINGTVAVDTIIRFERLEEDFRDLCSRLGIASGRALPREKAAIRSQRGYRAMYSEESRRAVAALNQMEIDEFGYAF
ncbi:sulfotransferase family 2 domain-containing protein [Devosia sp.]|uniref:sulfotransferase family 2 domain-containing protein n=1 Tax=Devosia sp. TaxID=1871048 RepID=UPI003A94F905